MIHSNASRSEPSQALRGASVFPPGDGYVGLEDRIRDLDSRLVRLASAVGAPLPAPAQPAVQPAIQPAVQTPVERARAEYKARRRRERILDIPGLFADPAWDILLDLYVARCEGKRIATSSACIAACVPVTTGLRWLTALESDGLIHKEADENDKRRIFVEISDDAFARMTRYFEGHTGQTT